MYQQESLKAGLATRAIKFSGAREWHICDDRIVWSNLVESISTRLLRSSKASSSRNSGMKRLDIKKLIPKHWRVKLVQAASTDTVLVTAEVDPNFGPSIPDAHKLILVSLSGKIKWIADVDTPFSRPAIGKASLYLIYFRTATAFSDDQDSKVVLMKLSLSTGAVEMDKDLSIAGMTYGLRPVTFFGDESLVLSMDETYAMWVDGYIVHLPPGVTAWYHIICTTTGSVLYRYGNRHRPLIHSTTSSITQNALWAYGVPHTWLTSQSSHDRSWATRRIRLPGFRDPYYSSEPRTMVKLGFEGDRLLFSHLIHSKLTEIERQERFWSSGNSTRMRTSKFGVSSAIRGTDVPMSAGATEPPDMQYAPSTPSIVTLPDGNGGRRVLEVKLPWADDAVTFFGFVEDSIAYHVKRDQVLLLIDFWPDW